MMEPLQIDYDVDRDVITIDGIKYAGGIFRNFAIAPIGTVLRIDKREDGVITVTKLSQSGS